LREEALNAAVGSGLYTFKTPQQGAATSVLLAASPLVEGVGGRYFEDCEEALPHRPGTHRGVADHAVDAGAAGRLWQVSLEHIGAHSW
jgi:hypothetical protein